MCNNNGTALPSSRKIIAKQQRLKLNLWNLWFTHFGLWVRVTHLKMLCPTGHQINGAWWYSIILHGIFGFVSSKFSFANPDVVVFCFVGNPSSVSLVPENFPTSISRPAKRSPPVSSLNHLCGALAGSSGFISMEYLSPGRIKVSGPSQSHSA